MSYRSRHNLNTWGYGNYLGLGVSASSKNGNKRWTNISNIKEYIDFYLKNVNNTVIARKDDEVIPIFSTSTKSTQSKSIFSENIEILPVEKFNEYIMLQFRKTEGLNLSDFEKDFSYKFYDKNKLLVEKYIKSLHLEFSNNKETLYLTNKGFDVYNYIVSDFFIE